MSGNFEFKFHLVFFEEFSSRIKKVTFLIPVVLFIIIPLILQFSIMPAITILSDFILGLKMVFSFIGFTYLIGIAIPIFVLLESVSFFSRLISNGTMQILVAKPIKRWEIFAGKFLDFFSVLFACFFSYLLIQTISLAFLSSFCIQLFLGITYIFFQIWITVFIFAIVLYSMMTMIDILASSPIKSFIINMIFFLIYPLVLVPLIITSMETMIISNLSFNRSIIIPFIDLLYLFCIQYHPYTILYHSLNYWMVQTDLFGLSSNFQRLLYPGSFQFSCYLLLTMLICANTISLLIFSRKDLND
ncbi:MAG: ABC transporter permease subunit [Candidatus Helarchaeota archaeon]